MSITVGQLIEILSGMDPEREVYSTAEADKKIKGVGTIEIKGKEVAVIR